MAFARVRLFRQNKKHTLMRTPITYWGGKQSLAARILTLIPPHTTYVEPFFGGGAVFFQKAKSHVEVVNDLNRFVVNFYQQARDNFPALQKRIRATLHSRSLHDDARVMYQHPHLFSDLDRAWAFFVLCNQGYSGKIGTWGYGIAAPGSEKKAKNDRENFADDIRERLEQVQIECTDALRIIRFRDRAETFFYLDPPYHNANMGHYGGYTAADFEALLQACAGMEGKFLLSSYPSDLLESYTAANGWHTLSLDMMLAASPKKGRKTEVLTANFPLVLPEK